MVGMSSLRTQEARGFDHLRQHWIDAAAHIGDEISLDLGQGKVMTGVFETIGSDGSLLLRGQDGGITAIQAGDVLRARPEGTAIAAGPGRWMLAALAGATAQ